MIYSIMKAKLSVRLFFLLSIASICHCICSNVQCSVLSFFHLEIMTIIHFSVSKDPIKPK